MAVKAFYLGDSKVSNVCDICGKKKFSGSTIIRRGLAKKKGGIGMHEGLPENLRTEHPEHSRR